MCASKLPEGTARLAPQERQGLLSSARFRSTLAGSQLSWPGSRQNPLNHKRRYRTGELLIQALELVTKFIVVDAEAVKNGRVEIVNVHRIFHNVVTVPISSPNVMPGRTPAPAIQTVERNVVWAHSDEPNSS